MNHLIAGILCVVPTSWYLVYHLPRKCAVDYITKSLKTDMVNPFGHYNDGGNYNWLVHSDNECGVIVGETTAENAYRQKSRFFVAVMKSDTDSCDVKETVVGTVAVEPAVRADGRCDNPLLYRPNFEDAELRRMSVSPHVRGLGVAKKLFEALEQFCMDAGYKRIVLSTSGTQVDAVKMYPKFGFAMVETQTHLSVIKILYVIKNLTEPKRI